MLIRVPSIPPLPLAIRSLGVVRKHWNMPDWQWKLMLETKRRDGHMSSCHDRRQLQTRYVWQRWSCKKIIAAWTCQSLYRYVHVCRYVYKGMLVLYSCLHFHVIKNDMILASTLLVLCMCCLSSCVLRLLSLCAGGEEACRQLKLQWVFLSLCSDTYSCCNHWTGWSHDPNTLDTRLYQKGLSPHKYSWYSNCYISL